MYILLVEDDLDSRITLAKFLRHLGHHVTEAGNGKEALDLFHKGNFHMVLTDIKMPQMSGIELLQKISRDTDREVAVVIFTGYGDLHSAIEALRAGAYDYLLKPINIKELAVLVERIAEHQSLKKEHRILTTRYDSELKAATGETQQELKRFKAAYAYMVGTGEIGIFSKAMKSIFKQAAKFHSDRSIPVLIQGETGTGKEVVAKYIHYGKDIDPSPFVDINCAAIPANIFESELFGYESGAFTGGLQKGQKGKLDLAQGGTLFLDEISEMSPELQSKLLRVIQEKEYYRVGGLKKIKADFRLICATNTDIEMLVQQGRFRQDLFYRLNTARIILPPLRERPNEILPLTVMFLRRYARKRGKKFTRVDEKAARVLQSYHWPGNVRELMNVIEYTVFMHDDEALKAEHLNSLPQFQNTTNAGEKLLKPVTLEDCSLPPDGLDLTSLNESIILRALKMHNGNKTKTAAYLGITRRVLDYRLKTIKGKKRLDK